MQSKTIKEKIKIQGKGIHTNLNSKVFLHPHNNKIEFFVKKKLIKINPFIISNTQGSTDLPGLKTIEHLLASLFINKIDNILIEVIGPEIPILDGSIKVFNQLLQNNTTELPQKAEVFQILYPLVDQNNPPFYFINTSDTLEVYCLLQDPKRKTKTLFYWNEYSEIIPAKTYGYFQDFYIFEKLNLGKGSNYFNTNILSLYKNTHNIYELNYHKIIDFLGDIYTTNIPYIKGFFFLYNPNHTINNQIAKLIYGIYKNLEGGLKVC